MQHSESSTFRGCRDGSGVKSICLLLQRTQVLHIILKGQLPASCHSSEPSAVPLKALRTHRVEMLEEEGIKGERKQDHSPPPQYTDWLSPSQEQPRDRTTLVHASCYGACKTAVPWGKSCRRQWDLGVQVHGPVRKHTRLGSS